MVRYLCYSIKNVSLERPIKHILVLFLIVSLLLTGCTSQAEESVSENTVTFTDNLGRTVTVENPRRVAALLGSFAQVWMLAGGDVIATADDAWDDLQLELSETAVNLGNTKALSLELLRAAQPDFILASTNTRQNVQWQDTLEVTGIPVCQEQQPACWLVRHWLCPVL